MKKIVAIFGYNNTRSYDVLKIREICARELNAEVLLIKEGLTPEDRALTSYALDASPDSQTIAELLKPYLERYGLALFGCLPFSDKGVVGAAHCAQAFGLPGDSVRTAEAMLNKSTFRELEASLDLDPAVYRTPTFKAVYSLQDAQNFFNVHGAFFIKPTSEGNSRGCRVITSLADISDWSNQNPNAFRLGAICEEILNVGNEYSFDGVDGHYWITEKLTTSGSFRAEYQHIVPAPLPPDVYRRTHDTLRTLISKLGSKGGAFHHEFFLLEDGRIASVEPNRRPAGMWIWDLAAATLGFDPWTRWIRLCTGMNQQSLPKSESIGLHSGVRAVIAPADGRVSAFDETAIRSKMERRFGSDGYRLAILKSVGAQVRKTPRDNSDFVAFVALTNLPYAELRTGLAEAEDTVLHGLEIEPKTNSYHGLMSL